MVNDIERQVEAKAEVYPPEADKPLPVVHWY
jgi:hypothetical protein